MIHAAYPNKPSISAASRGSPSSMIVQTGIHIRVEVGGEHPHWENLDIASPSIPQPKLAAWIESLSKDDVLRMIDELATCIQRTGPLLETPMLHRQAIMMLANLRAINYSALAHRPDRQS